jgi:uncharacterized protein
VLIQIDKLKRRPRQIDVAEEATGFPVLSELVAAESVTFNEPIRGSLEAIWVGDFIKVTGKMMTQVSTPCCRCLAPVSTRLEVPVLLTYSNHEEGETLSDDDLELQADDLGLITFSGDELDLQPDVEQEIVMALPQHPLCKDSCLGLCHSCGCNLNQSRCNCAAPILHPGLAALKNFKV